MTATLPDRFDEFVNLLGDPHRRVRAYTRLLSASAEALPAVRRGLAHESPVVRRGCCRLLDHLADAESLADLVRMVSDPHPGVRIQALHALACDRCKDTACRPSADEVLPVVLPVLHGDPHKHVRAMACEVVARWVHSRDEARAALCAARDLDPDPSVRKKAGWYTPGGPIYRKTAPPTPKRARRNG